MAIAVLTDSAAGIPEPLRQQLGIAVVPIYIRFGQELLRDGEELTPATFYQRLEAGGPHPATAAPSAGDFLEAYRRLERAGASGVVAVLLGSGLSGTFEAASQAAALCGQLPVRLVDSGSLSMATGFMAMEAARQAAEGARLEQVASAAERVGARLSIRFTLETLEYLRRGGRIGAAAAWIGSLLELVPILTVSNSKIVPLARVRTKARALRQIIDEIGASAEQRPLHVAIVHAAAAAEAEALAAQVRARYNCSEMVLTEMSPVLGVHAGPRALGVGWYSD